MINVISSVITFKNIIFAIRQFACLYCTAVVEKYYSNLPCCGRVSYGSWPRFLTASSIYAHIQLELCIELTLHLFPVAQILVPNSRSPVFCYGIRERRWTVLPLIKGTSLFGRKDPVLWCRNYLSTRIPARGGNHLQGSQGINCKADDWVWVTHSPCS